MFITQTANLYDKLYSFWLRPSIIRCITLSFVFVFLFTGLTILLGYFHLIPVAWTAHLPNNPFFAIRLAFTLILVTEVIELIFAIAKSLSLAASKQMEIMALILLRESFSDIGLLSADITTASFAMFAPVAVTAGAGLLLYIFRGLFLKIHQIKEYTGDMSNYINTKKCICVFLFFFLFYAGIYDLHNVLVLGEDSSFFKILYTFLIFTDILLILVGHYFLTGFHATFRNSGFAVSSLLMRLALSAPHNLSAALCIFSGLYLLILTWVDSRLLKDKSTKGQS